MPLVAPVRGLWDTLDLESVVPNKREKYAQDRPRTFRWNIPAARALLPYPGTVYRVLTHWGYYPLLSQILFSGPSSSTGSNGLPSSGVLLFGVFCARAILPVHTKHKHGSVMKPLRQISGKGTSSGQDAIEGVVNESLRDVREAEWMLETERCGQTVAARSKMGFPTKHLSGFYPRGHVPRPKNGQTRLHVLRTISLLWQDHFVA